MCLSIIFDASGFYIVRTNPLKLSKNRQFGAEADIYRWTLWEYGAKV